MHSINFCQVNVYLNQTHQKGIKKPMAKANGTQESHCTLQPCHPHSLTLDAFYIQYVALVSTHTDLFLEEVSLVQFLLALKFDNFNRASVNCHKAKIQM